jgi:hypothetical protein
MICPVCQSVIADNSTECVACRTTFVPAQNYPYQQFPEQQCYNSYLPEKKKEIKPWLVALCVSYPLLGLILWFVYKEENEELAEMYGKTALWSFIFVVGAFLLSIVMIFIMGLLTALAGSIA